MFIPNLANNKTNNLSTYSSAFKASTPVMFGYIPMGIAFGVLFQNLGYEWYFAPLMGLLVYAGAAQFMAVGLLAAQASLLEVTVAIFILNLRHMFFGVSLLGHYRVRGLKKFYLIFGLTDETYSLITATHASSASDQQGYYLALTAFNHFYWVLGCTVGAGIGMAVEFDATGMDFTLTALFTVLLIEQVKKLRETLPFLIALICGIFALLFFKDQMLLVSIALSIVILLLQFLLSGRLQ